MIKCLFISKRLVWLYCKKGIRMVHSRCKRDHQGSFCWSRKELGLEWWWWWRWSEQVTLRDVEKGKSLSVEWASGSEVAGLSPKILFWDDECRQAVQFGRKKSWLQFGHNDFKVPLDFQMEMLKRQLNVWIWSKVARSSLEIYIYESSVYGENWSQGHVCKSSGREHLWAVGRV